jgi:proteic killer suppression protein
VIRSWRHKGLQELFETGRSRRVRQDQVERIVRRLDALNAATSVKAVDIPGFGLHALKGKPTRWAIAVNGPWRITFEWQENGACEVDLEQYH